MANTDVALYRMDETSGVILVHQHIRISNREYPDASTLVGPATHLSWSPDGYCLAIAWKHCGWALCSVFGALLHSSLGEHIGLTNRVRLSHLVWSAGGCQLLSFLSFLDPKKTPPHCDRAALTYKTTDGECDSPLFEDGVKDNDLDAHLVMFRVVRSALTTNPTLDNHRHVLLQTVDRIIYSSRSQLTLSRNPQTIHLPLVYLRQNYPPQYVAANAEGDRIAVAGKRGFTHYCCTTGRWYVFGNEVQERSIHVSGGMAWWNRFLCCCCLVLDKGIFEFRMYPAEKRLDDQFASVYRFTEQAEPLLLDCLNNLVTVLASNGRVQILLISAPDSENRKPPLLISLLQTIVLTNLIPFPTCVVRLCLCSVAANLPRPTSTSHPQRPKTDDKYSPDLMQFSTDALDSTPAQGELADPCMAARFTPPRSLLINYAGHVFILQPNKTPDEAADKDDPHKRRPLILTPFLIATHVELVWTTASVSVQASLPHPLHGLGTTTSNELSLAPYLNTSLWLYCGSAGLFVWLPLPKLHPSSPGEWDHELPIHNSGFPASPSSCSPKWRRHGCTHLIPGYVSRRIMLSIELEEHVHPLAILFHQAILIGIMNDFHRPLRITAKRLEHISADDFYAILPHGVLVMETHAFLHRLIQQLLCKNLGAHALQLCSAYQNVPHFRRLLEWLLHEVLETEATSKYPIPDPLLPQVVAFIQEFPYFLETVAQCARKTEVARWPHLFTAVGRRPKDLFDLCLDENNLHAATAYLIILQSSESAALSQRCTLRFLDIAIDMSEWDLIRDLIRFLNAIDPCELKCMSLASPGPNTSTLTQCADADSNTMKQSFVIPDDVSGTEKARATRNPVEAPTASVEVAPARVSRISSTRADSECDHSFVGPTLSDHIWQLVTHKATQYFAQGRLKEMAELAANFPTLCDTQASQHRDRLANWIAHQK
ncbi:unnamed protein product [Dicrocoelium dendriticum]|nr:unnamed protein product [Dicrocoelium dendriticum]